jgi:hypothetical protein
MLMKSVIPFLAAAALAATPAALAAPHSGSSAMGVGMGAGGMGGARGNFTGLRPITGGPVVAPAGVQKAPTSGKTASPDAASSPGSKAVAKGKPNQSCQAGANYPANTPGNSFNAPGSAFNPNGVADSKYAGTQPQNSKNPNSVAQYDVACTNQK